MMNKGENSDTIPIDLILEILSRLPTKSIGRFRCVSKLWCSMLNRPYFSDLFLTRSSARPRLLFLVKRYNECSFFSAPQLQHPYGKSSPVVAVDSHMKFSGSMDIYGYSYTAGLIYFSYMSTSKPVVRMICNPITANYVILPELLEWYTQTSYLGFDPIGKQFKVLSMNNDIAYNDETFNYILTLGTDKVRRIIQCPFKHEPLFERICINGVLYYLAQHSYQRFSFMIVCFDFRSEKFKCVEAECFPDNYRIKLINYKGKLAGIDYDYDRADKNTIKFRMWVLEDVEKHELSKYVFTLPKHEHILLVITAN